MKTKPRHTALPEYLGMVRRMVRAAGRRVAFGDPEHLAELIAIREHLDLAIIEAVQGLRTSGFTWQSIGDALGTSGQAACMKWGPHCRLKDEG